MKILDSLIHWSFLAVAGIIYVLGETIKSIFFNEQEWKDPKGWKSILKRTMVIHPVIIGLLLGLAPLPAPEAIQLDVSARMVYFGFAGVASAWSYKVLQTFFQVEVPAILKRLAGNTSNQTKQEESEKKEE